MTTDADSHLVKYAEDLAAVAVLPEKTANSFMDALKDPAVQRYLGYGLGGAGLGALLGYLQRGDKKKRNALSYGLMGGMGGLGLAALAGGLGNMGAQFATTDEPSGPPTAMQQAAQSAKRLGAAATTPTKDLPRFEPISGDSLATQGLNLAGNTAQQLVDNGVLPADQSPAATAAGGGGGLLAGLLANRTGLGKGLNSIVGGSTNRLVSGLENLAARLPTQVGNSARNLRNSIVDSALARHRGHRGALQAETRAPVIRNITNTGRGKFPSDKEFRWAISPHISRTGHSTSLDPAAAARFTRRFKRPPVSVPAVRPVRGTGLGRVLGTIFSGALPALGAYGGAHVPGMLSEANRDLSGASTR